MDSTKDEVNKKIVIEQYKFIREYEKKIKDLKRSERIYFYIELNEKIIAFCSEHIKDLFLDMQKLIYFSYWIGNIFLDNFDIVYKLQLIFNFCNFSIIKFNLSTMGKPFYLSGNTFEEIIIIEKKKEFEEKYFNIIGKVKIIQKFLKKQHQKKNLQKYLASISQLNIIFPKEIVEKIIIKEENIYQKIYIKYRSEIDTMIYILNIDYTNLNYIIDKFIQNNFDIFNTLSELSNYNI